MRTLISIAAFMAFTAVVFTESDEEFDTDVVDPGTQQFAAEFGPFENKTHRCNFGEYCIHIEIRRLPWSSRL